jgi:hypothetical protein
MVKISERRKGGGMESKQGLRGNLLWEEKSVTSRKVYDAIR